MNDTIQTQSTARPTLSVEKMGEDLKILKVTGLRGMSMPLHYCTSDAVVQVESGASELRIDQNRHTLRKGDCYLIPSGIPHQLKLLEDFRANVIMPTEAEIKFCKSENASS